MPRQPIYGGPLHGKTAAADLRGLSHQVADPHWRNCGGEPCPHVDFTTHEYRSRRIAGEGIDFRVMVHESVPVNNETALEIARASARPSARRSRSRRGTISGSASATAALF